MITFDNKQSGEASSASFTVGSSSNRILILFTFANIGNAGGTITTPTYNGTNFVQVGSGTSLVGVTNNASCWVLVNPPTGSNTLALNSSGFSFPSQVFYTIYSYSGAAQTGQPDAFGTSSGTVGTISVQITTVLNNCLILGIGADMTGTFSTVTTGTNNTLSGNEQESGDFGTLATGTSETTSITSGGGDTRAALEISIAPALVTLLPSVSDSTAVSDTPKIVKTNEISVSSSTAVSDTPIIEILSYSNFDGLASLVSTGYKWITSTLLAIQQQFNRQPFFTVKILDDSITWNQTVLSVDTNGPRYGKVIVAPDGNTLAIGWSGGNNLSFWKVANPSTTEWANFTVLDSSSTFQIKGFCSIAVSNYINGTYVIDVYYVTGSPPQIQHQQSKDGGITWTKNPYSITQPFPHATSLYQSGNYNFCIQAAQPILLLNGNVQSMFFYILDNSNTFETGYTGYDIWYQRYAGSGSTFNAVTKWGTRNVNSQDWTIQSFDTQWYNNTWLIAIAGFHNIYESVNTALSLANANYSVYTTVLRNTSDVSTTDLWDEARVIIPSLSNAGTNLEAYTDLCFSYDGTNIWLSMQAVLVESISDTSQSESPSVVTTTTNYYIIRTQDGINFTYPTIVADSNGNVLTDGLATAQAYYFTGGFYYMNAWDNGTNALDVWQFIQNDATADVSAYAVSYTVSDQFQSPSSINLEIANDNNQWFPSGTLPNASAIKKNAKILLSQGYYNALGEPETVPKGIFYIDDIQQQISSNQQQLLFVARDLYKKMIVTVTQYALNLLGPFIYSDVFNGTTLGSWNQTSGGWQETANSMMPTATTESDIILAGLVQKNPEAFMAVTVNIPSNSTGYIYIYAMYQDATHWVRLRVNNNGSNNLVWVIQYMLDGATLVTYASGTVTDTFYDNVGGTIYANHTFIVRRYDWYKFAFFVGTSGLVSSTGAANDNSGNTPWYIDPTAGGSIIRGNSPIYLNQNNDLDITSEVTTLANGVTTLGSIGFGTTINTSAFTFFKFFEFTKSSNTAEVEKYIGTQSGIFNYIQENIFSDDIFTPTLNYTGIFTSPNRILTITAGNSAMNNGNQVGAGSIEFDAKITPTNLANASGFKFVFRSQSDSPTDNSYQWENGLDNSGAFSFTNFNMVTNALNYTGTYLLNSSSLQYELSGKAYFLNNLNFDFTQWHHYKIIMVDGWFYGFIDGVLVNAWQDNNTTQPFYGSTTYPNGFWGFVAEANTQLQVKNIKSPVFWNQIPTFSFNPGDEMESSFETAEGTIFGIHFSDLFGRLKSIVRQSTDPSTYSYDDLINTQQVDNSDKEYVNRVQVIGLNGIKATASDTASISETGAIREQIVVDFTITTLQSAQTRANQVLADAEKYGTQYTPSQPLNVGSEIMDVVTIINTGNNSSGVSQNVRIYNQTEVSGGQTHAQFDLQIETGTL